MLAHHVAAPLMTCSRVAAAAGVDGMPMPVTWHLLPSNHIIQRGVHGLQQFDSLPEQPVVQEPSCDGHAEGSNKAVSSPSTSLSGSKRSREEYEEYEEYEKNDFLAEVYLDNSAASQQPAITAAAAAAASASSAAAGAAAAVEEGPAKTQHSILVGQVEMACMLMVDQQPKDLVEQWEQGQQPVQAVIAQLFTCMQVQQVCYSFLSCWFATWLAYCPPQDRGTLYLSEPVLAETKHLRGTAPAVTTRGAISWLQQQAIRNINAILDPLPPPADGYLLDEDGQGMFKPRASVQLHGKPRTGSAGLVSPGVCNGKAAVIKMYGPDRPGRATYRRELHVYKQLAEQLQEARPGFLHGDIRLANVLLVGSATGDDVDDMKCMMIDFGQSELRATGKHMRREVKQLKRLLGC
eukprot:jgi/Chrzof1/10282/Cz04g35160.t1